MRRNFFIHLIFHSWTLIGECKWIKLSWSSMDGHQQFTGWNRVPLWLWEGPYNGYEGPYDGLFHPPQALLDKHSYHVGGATTMKVVATKCKFEIYREPFNATVDIAYTSKVIAMSSSQSWKTGGARNNCGVERIDNCPELFSFHHCQKMLSWEEPVS